jgi:hypothetical protein
MAEAAENLFARLGLGCGFHAIQKWPEYLLRHTLVRIGNAPMAGISKGPTRFRNRREAERVLAEIISDGGRPADYRIDEDTDGCLITVLEADGARIAGAIGA